MENAVGRGLAGLLGDRRPAVRQRAIETLAEKGQAALQPITKILEPRRVDIRRNAIWTLARMDDPALRLLILLAFDGDRSESVRQVAAHCLSLRRERGAVPSLIKRLATDTPLIQREASEALGRIGDRSAVPALLAAAAETTDRVLAHSLTYALIQIADPKASAEGLTASRARDSSGRADRPGSDGRRWPGVEDRRRFARVRRHSNSGNRDMDRRPPPGMGRRAGRLFPRPIR